MKVRTAETAGFCFGVKRAVDEVYRLISEEKGPIFTIGPVIPLFDLFPDLFKTAFQSLFLLFQITAHGTGPDTCG